MSMRLSLILCGSLALGLAAPLWGQAASPRAVERATVQRSGGAGLTGGGQSVAGKRRPAGAEDLFYEAYKLRRRSEQLAEAKNYNAAIKMGQEAEKRYAILVRDFPTWQPNLVADRRKVLADNLKAYRSKASDAKIPTGRQPGRTLPKDGDIALPTLPTHMPGADYVPEELPDYHTTDKELYNKLARAQEECRSMAAAYKELSGKFKDLQAQLAKAELNQQMYKERYEKLQADFAQERQTGNEVVSALGQQLTEMEAKYNASEKARKEAEARVAQLETQLAETQAELARVTRERDALKAENEQLRAIVELNSPEKTRALLDQNLTLAEQLKTAQARVTELEAQIQGSGDQNMVLNQQLDDAREETERLREEMSGIYDENMGYRRRISELTERLNNLEADLDKQASAPTIDPATAEENKLLREVIAKQRRTIAMQEEGRKLLIETYKQIKNQDPAMLIALQKLDDESRLDLTDAERRVMDSVKGSGQGSDAEGAEAVRRSLEVETLANLAARAFAKGRFTAAEQLYRTLYDAQPDHVAGLVNLGTILLNRNKSEEAAELFSRASRLAPDLAITYFLAGIAHYRLDQLDQARRMFSRTVELDPANAEAFFYLANIEGVSGEVERALKHFAAAVKLKPALGDAHYNMARLYAETERIPDAARAYDRAVNNGAEPDPAFEEYLRNHPDSAKAPGTDLVAEVKPEDEAAQLRAENPDGPLPLPDEGNESDGSEDGTAPAEGEGQAPGPEISPEEASFRKEWSGITSHEIKTAPTPSPAGMQHETDAKRFRTKRVRTRVDGRRRRIELRMKLPAEQRLRQRGGEIRVVKPGELDKK